VRRQQRGPFAAGDQVQLTDPKGRKHLITLQAGKSFHTHHGSVDHDDLIGREEGSVVQSSGGTPYVALRPLLADFTLSMKRGAAVVYPKDAAQIIALADVFPGARVLEAGAGSGALTCWLLRAVGEGGAVISFERRPDFAEIARRNVERFFGGPHPAWHLVTADFGAPCPPGDAGGPAGPAAGPAGEQEGADRVVLDMLAPWECVDAAAAALVPGGVICCYVATTTQLSRTVEGLRGQGSFDEPAAWESLVRGWHVDGLAVRPEQRMVGHTGFLVTARRLARGVTPPPRRRRPARGAHQPDPASGPEPRLTSAFRDLPVSEQIPLTGLSAVVRAKCILPAGITGACPWRAPASLQDRRRIEAER
jgi:tRNA (adenine57-N1/adenine58-N1)-methyltransferase